MEHTLRNVADGEAVKDETTDRLRVRVNGVLKNLRIYHDGPYTLAPNGYQILNGTGTPTYTADRSSGGVEENVVPIVERWNHYYALYVMLK